MLTRREVLRSISVGHRVAEQEIDNLARYFVETDQWRRIFAGDVDIIYGAKGSGKSAIYTVLVDRRDQLFDRDVLVRTAENPSGATAFSDLAVDPPSTEKEFIGLWKLYIVSLIGDVIRDFAISNEQADELLEALSSAGLLPPPRTLAARVKVVLAYVRQLVKLESIEAGVNLDPNTGQPIGVTGKITLGHPSQQQSALGFRSVDELLDIADRAMDGAGYSVWLLFDRLDVAFVGSEILEANALRALFKVYLDLSGLGSISLKIFLRTDIWAAITESGFREASHITRTLTLTWDRPELLVLILRRLLQSEEFRRYYDLPESEQILTSSELQESLLLRALPEKVDSGRNPATFDWMIGRVADGHGSTAPRELIHLVSEARDQQLRLLDSGQPEPPAEQLLDRSALRAALPAVSRVRLEQTLFAEYPDLKQYLQALFGEKTSQYVESLVAIWGLSHSETEKIASRLVDVGFFNLRGSKENPEYWVPFLYRTSLEMVQGTAG